MTATVFVVVGVALVVIALHMDLLEWRIKSLEARVDRLERDKAPDRSWE